MVIIDDKEDGGDDGGDICWSYGCACHLLSAATFLTAYYGSLASPQVLGMD